MANNVDRAVGLVPVGHAAGGTPQRMSGYTIAPDTGVAIFYGDPVKATGTGLEIARANPGDRLTGAFAGCQYVDASGAIVFSPFWPANQATQAGSTIEAFVVDDPATVYEIQASGDLQPADIRAGADLVVGAGNPATGNAGAQLDSATIGIGGQIKILGLAQRVDNDYGEHAVIRVTIANHELGGGATAV